MKRFADKKFTKRTRFTRQCIGESILALAGQKDFDSITVSDIAKKAGVSRMTFYHHFRDKSDALSNYLQEIINGYLETYPDTFRLFSSRKEETIRRALCYFDQYAPLFVTLDQAGLHCLLIRAINEYMMLHAAPLYPGSVYDLYYYAGALLNVFLQWETSGKKEPADEIVQILVSLTPSREALPNSLPHREDSPSYR